ncbi:MAG: diguanylate cyclase/phosphodiesterase (GGDEF & EAL domains) with PAS/PAC sensor(s), partial [uncultured Solirubrobacteraceae bacterium]
GAGTGGVQGGAARRTAAGMDRRGVPAGRPRATPQTADLLASIVRSSGDAMYALTRDDLICSWNSAAEQLFGFRAEEVMGCPVDVIVPPGLAEEVAAITAAVVSTGEVHHRETRRLRRDGSVVDVALTVSPIHDGAGRIVGRSAIARDITDRKRAERELATARQRFERAFEDAPIGMAIVDLDGRFAEVNRALREFLGRDDAALLGRHASCVAHPDDLEEQLRTLRSVREGAQRTAHYEARFVRPDGAQRWGAVGASVVRDGDGPPLHYVVQVLDITARRTQEQQLASYTDEVKERTSRDPVTGLPARPAFEADIAARMAAGEALTVLLLAAEGLPTVLDRHDRGAADAALRAAAAAVASACRASDRTYRPGLRTLALVLPGASRRDAHRAADRIRRHAEAHEPALRLTSHVLELPAGASSLTRLLRELDDATAADGGPSVQDPATLGAPAAPHGPGPVLADTADRIAAMLAAARAHLAMDVAWLSEFSGGRQVFRALDGDAASFGLAAGEGLPLSGSICLRVLDGRLPAAIGDTSRHPAAAELEVTARARLGAYAGAPVRLADGRLYGMLCAASHAARPALDDRDVGVLALVADLVAERIDHESRQATRRRLDVEDAGVSALLAALDARDHYTAGHSEAVVELSAGVARALGLPGHAVQEVEQVALLHDIGKVGIPDSVLHKPGPLDELEWELMRQHSALGGRILAGIASLAHLSAAVRAEHERWDGLGYPDGLSGTAIPIAARIILAADAYHAMTSDRPYRSAMPPAAALDELRACAGTQFDPAVVDALVAVVAPPAAIPPAPVALLT